MAKVNPLAASGFLAKSPKAVERYDMAKTKATITAATPSQRNGSLVGRNPMISATTTTIAVVRTLRTTLAST